MRKGWPVLLLLALLAAGLLVGLALAGQVSREVPTTWYAVRQGIASGGGYLLAGGNWEVRGAAQGSGYRLQPSGATILQGAGCCCTFLPCTYR